MANWNDLKFPTLTAENTTETKEPITGAGSTAPVSEINQPIIETPTVLPTEPVIQEAPTPEPVVVEPTITPEVTVEPTKVVEPTVVEPKIVEPVVEPTKQPTGKVETAQDIKAKETSNKASEDALNEQNKIVKTDEFNKMVQSGATLEELSSFGIENPAIRKDLAVILRDNLKNTANVKYFGKYSTMTNEQLSAEVNAGNIVPWSDQFNLLPENQRLAFKQFQATEEAVNINEKTNFTSSEKAQSVDTLVKGMSGIFSTDLRKAYSDSLSSPAFLDLSSKLSSKKAEIEKFDISMEDQAENIRKELAWNLPWAINAAVRDANRDSVKEKRLLLAEYGALQWEYSNLKSNAALELDFIKYEDQQAKEVYMTALGLYETRRGEMRQDQKTKLIEDNRKLASETQFARQKELATFNEELRQSGNAWGKYIDNGKWDLVYIKNGKEISVLTWLWESIGVAEDDNYSFQIKTNEDGSHTVFWLPKEGTNVFQKSYWVDWNAATSWIKWTGQWNITSYGWTHDKFQWLDIDGNVWDPIASTQAGKVVDFEHHSAYWTTMVVETEDGNKIRYSHLDKWFKRLWDTIEEGTIIGTIWNSGNVLKLDGKRPSAAELKAWFGSHLDIVTTWPDGVVRSAKQTESYLNNLWVEEVSDTLSERQQIFFNQQQSKFRGDPQVKAFESALSSGWDLIRSLDSVSWPGDVAAIFQFMKTLDPSSVVRESEFAVAGNSAGMSSKPELILKKISTWELLTEVQRKEFGRLAFEYINNKWELYDIKYDDMSRVLWNAKIWGTNLPTRITDLIWEFKTNDIKEISWNKSYSTTSGYTYDPTWVAQSRSTFFTK